MGFPESPPLSLITVSYINFFSIYYSHLSIYLKNLAQNLYQTTSYVLYYNDRMT